MADAPEVERSRTFEAGLNRQLVRALAILISLVCLSFVLDVFFYFDVTFYKEQLFGLIYGLVLSTGFLLYPASKRSSRSQVPVYDYMLAALGFAVGAFVFVAWPTIVQTIGVYTWPRLLLGGAAILLVLELTRRIFGWPLVIIAVLFILYAKFNYLLSGPLGGRGTSWERITTFLYLDTNSMLGFIAAVIFGMVFAYILFGRVLFVTGGAEFFTDFSMALMGKRRGGPAKVAVVASSLFGTLSGSASGNVVITGSITIPMMIRTGYSPPVAAAVEAVASSGGGLMPPIMGATAFIMADFLAVPYQEVVVAAVIPAVLYYIALFVQVDLEAAKANLRGVSADKLPRLGRVLMRGWVFVIPLAILVYCLFVLFLSPSKSAIYAILSLIVISVFRKSTRFTPAKAVATLEDSGRLLVEIGVIGAVAAFVVAIVNLTGIGLVISQVLLSVAGGSIMLLLLLTGMASIILGMSMPVTASYIVLAVLAAPALVEANVPEIASHLFIFYFAILSFITPPVCVAVYIASTIANTRPMKSAVQAMKLAIVAYIVPFVFVFDPALLMQGSAVEIAIAVISNVAGFVGIAIALQGYFTGRVPLWLRGLMGAAGLTALLTFPIVKAAGTVLVLAFVAWQWRLRTPLAGEDPNADGALTPAPPGRETGRSDTGATGA